MAQACPINFTTVDETISRIISLFTMTLVVIFVFTDVKTVLIVLGIDLLVRLYGDKKLSPLFHAAEWVKQLLKLPTSNVDGAAKKVAGHFGLIFILLLLLSAFVGNALLLNAVAGVFVGCLLLDLLFGFCLGCKMYHLYHLVVR